MQNKITQAVILSAGFGTRLRKVTGDTLPKVMVSLAGKPLLEWHIEQFKKHGIKEFFINLHYLPDVITSYFGDGSQWGVHITYAYEPMILGTAGGVKNFYPIEGASSSGGSATLGNRFFVIYGDIFSLMDYTKMAVTFEERPNAIGMELIGETDHPYDSDLVEVDDELRFIKIRPKPHKVLPPRCKAMRGVYIFTDKIFLYIPEKQYYEIDHQLLPDVLSRGERFYGYECGDFVKDIGTPERYEEVNRWLTGKGLDFTPRMG